MTSSISILIDKDGNILNPGQNIIVKENNVNGNAEFCIFNHQLTLVFLDDIIINSAGYKFPDFNSVVTTSLSGSLEVLVYPDIRSPYPATLTPNNTINVAIENVRGWIGKAAKLEFIGTGITGANYINVMIDRT